MRRSITFIVRWLALALVDCIPAGVLYFFADQWPNDGPVVIASLYILSGVLTKAYKRIDRLNRWREAELQVGGGAGADKA